MNIFKVKNVISVKQGALTILLDGFFISLNSRTNELNQCNINQT